MCELGASHGCGRLSESTRALLEREGSFHPAILPGIENLFEAKTAKIWRPEICTLPGKWMEIHPLGCLAGETQDNAA